MAVKKIIKKRSGKRTAKRSKKATAKRVVKNPHSGKRAKNGDSVAGSLSGKRVLYNGEPAKNHAFRQWISGKLDPASFVKKYKSVTEATARGWASCWTCYTGSEFTGANGFPASASEFTTAKIRAAQKRAA